MLLPLSGYDIGEDRDGAKVQTSDDPFKSQIAEIARQLG
jgi:hypothetical protein